MIFTDYYKILGLTKTALPKEIKSAYRKLARKYHPDVNPNDLDAKKKFQEINEANEVLTDPVKRKKYDQYGKDWQQSGEYNPGGRSQRQSSEYQGSRRAGAPSGEDFSDFFESMFGNAGGARGGRQPRFKGDDIHAQLHLELIDASVTHKETVAVNGKNLRITIPAGIENGQAIKISGHGSPGINGGPSGDLFITFNISNHPAITRKGINLYRSIDLDLFTAILGGEIMIDTLNGKVKLRVKPETQNGTRIKLKGKGFPIYKEENQFGDFFITYSVKIPTNITNRQRELFSEISELQTVGEPETVKI